MFGSGKAQIGVAFGDSLGGLWPQVGNDIKANVAF